MSHPRKSYKKTVVPEVVDTNGVVSCKKYSDRHHFIFRQILKQIHQQDPTYVNPYHFPEQILHQIHPIALQTPLLCPSPELILQNLPRGLTMGPSLQKVWRWEFTMLFVCITKKRAGHYCKYLCSIRKCYVLWGKGWAGLWSSLQMRIWSFNCPTVCTLFPYHSNTLGFCVGQAPTQAGISRSLRISLLVEMLPQTAPVIPGTGLHTSWFALVAGCTQLGTHNLVLRIHKYCNERGTDVSKDQ